jgi:sporulation protein YlmC with PRC-barrel domain
MAYTDRDTYGMYKKYGKEGKGPGPRLMGADTLIGEDVYSTKDEDLGDIKEIMLDMNNGKIAYAVLSFGGFLGMGDKLFAVPWNALTLDTENKRFILDVEKDRLESAPGFDKDDWPDMADPSWQNTIHSYYGTKSYMDTSHETTSKKDSTTSAHRNNERIIPVAPVGTDHVQDKTDDTFHTHK